MADVKVRLYRISRLPRTGALPLWQTRVAAGFPSPADDYVEARLDLRDLVKHPTATFFAVIDSDSMTGEGMFPGTIIAIDRAEETCSGDVVLARLGAEMCVKQLLIEARTGRIALVSRNPHYAPIEIGESNDFEVWGKVVFSINRHPLNYL